VECCNAGMTIHHLASLCRHTKAVNVVRFSLCGEFLGRNDTALHLAVYLRGDKMSSHEINGEREGQGRCLFVFFFFQGERFCLSTLVPRHSVEMDVRPAARRYV